MFLQLIDNYEEKKSVIMLAIDALHAISKDHMEVDDLVYQLVFQQVNIFDRFADILPDLQWDQDETYLARLFLILELIARVDDFEVKYKLI